MEERRYRCPDKSSCGSESSNPAHEYIYICIYRNSWIDGDVYTFGESIKDFLKIYIQKKYKMFSITKELSGLENRICVCVGLYMFQFTYISAKTDRPKFQ